MKHIIKILILIVFFCFSCQTDDLDLFDPNAVRDPITIDSQITFADPNLVQEAKDLHARLQHITQKGIAFGQQEAIFGGLDFYEYNSLESDFSLAAGDYPAIIGFDLEGWERWDTSIPIERFLSRWESAIKNAHNNGSIITISWHASNPLSGGDAFDRTKVVGEMLEGGSVRSRFLRYLEDIAFFLNELKDENGRPIPVLFRPWHEMNGDFFYWGEGLRTNEEFKQLYRDTVTILSETYNVHNALYVYSPNIVTNAAEYMKNYPGDDYVDMLGIDLYDFRNGNFLNDAIRNLDIVENIAREKNMLFALTETGIENVPQSNWWTDNLYRAIRSSSITYVMIWRNARKDHFFGPYEGHPSEEDFRTFVSKDVILLNSDIQTE